MTIEKVTASQDDGLWARRVRTDNGVECMGRKVRAVAVSGESRGSFDSVVRKVANDSAQDDGLWVGGKEQTTARTKANAGILTLRSAQDQNDKRF